MMTDGDKITIEGLELRARRLKNSSARLSKLMGKCHESWAESRLAQAYGHFAEAERLLSEAREDR